MTRVRHRILALLPAALAACVTATPRPARTCRVGGRALRAAMLGRRR